VCDAVRHIIHVKCSGAALHVMLLLEKLLFVRNGSRYNVGHRT
jgi:hypothetical protein